MEVIKIVGSVISDIEIGFQNKTVSNLGGGYISESVGGSPSSYIFSCHDGPLLVGKCVRFLGPSGSY